MMNDLVGKRFAFQKSKIIPSSGVYEVVRLYNPYNPTEAYSHAVCAKVLRNGNLSFDSKLRIGVPIGWLKREVDEK